MTAIDMQPAAAGPLQRQRENWHLLEDELAKWLDITSTGNDMAHLLTDRTRFFYDRGAFSNGRDAAFYLGYLYFGLRMAEALDNELPYLSGERRHDFVGHIDSARAMLIEAVEHFRGMESGNPLDTNIEAANEGLRCLDDCQRRYGRTFTGLYEIN